MDKEQKLKEEYCIMQGYEKKMGYKVYTDAMDYDEFFVPYDGMDGYIDKDVEFWVDKTGNDESVYEDVDEAINAIEDMEGVPNFENWKFLKKEAEKNG